MNQPNTVPGLGRLIGRDIRQAWSTLVMTEVLFKLLEAWVLVPALALLLSVLLARAGYIAVSNQDILGFLLSGPGLLYAFLLSTITLGLLLVEQALILIVVRSSEAGRRPSLRQLLGAFLRHSWRIGGMSCFLLLLLILVLVPFVALAGLVYFLFLSGHDINFYLAERPPAFWISAGLGGLLLLAALLTVLFFSVRWAFALPILLYEGQTPRAALRASAERVRGRNRRVALYLVGWLLATLLLNLVLTAGFQHLAATLLERAGERPTLLILFLLVIQGLLLGGVSFVTMVGLGLLTRNLNLQRNEELGLRALEPGEFPTDPARPVTPLARYLVYATLGAAVVGPLFLWVGLARILQPRESVRVTAHRGFSRAAPENTLSAVRKAIECGADYAEIDVQLARDGQIVLLHDRDFKRVAGDSRRLEEVPWDEIRRLDVGKWFGPEFAGEPVPTLEEVIELARGKIRLNIELKLFGPDRGLARAVAQLVHKMDFESECVVTSFNLDALREMKQVNPRLRVGLIIAKALGNVSRLEVDLLSVRADWLSDATLRAAHRHNQEVHVWSVKEAGQMARFIKRGVDNLITDDPELALRIRDEWAGLSDPERLLLAARLLLGLDP